MCSNKVYGGMGYGSGSFAPCGGYWGLCDSCKASQYEAEKNFFEEAILAVSKKYDCSREAAIIILKKGR